MTLLLRTKGWRMRLTAALEAMAPRPHEWGAHDCFTGLAGGVTEAITGTDIAAPWRGRYGTAEEALRVLRGDGFETLDELVASLLPKTSRGDARLGDLAFVLDEHSPFGGVVGVFTGERIAVLTPRGMGTLPRTAAFGAFMVGE
jgi:hypothetical protein